MIMKDKDYDVMFVENARRMDSLETKYLLLSKHLEKTIKTQTELGIVLYKIVIWAIGVTLALCVIGIWLTVK